MHSELTTDLSKIRSNLNSVKSNRENVVLIKTGGLNPIHRSHVSNLIKTKEYLEKIYQLNVIGGFLSPTHDQYVRAKLGNECLPGQLRIELCQKAIEEENQQNWLAVDKAECMAPHFINFNQVTLSLQRFVNDRFRLAEPIRVIYVCGLDLFNRCGGLQYLQQSPLVGVAAIYRSGENASHIQSIIKRKPRGKPSNLYFMLLDNNDQGQSDDISSTLIRQRLRLNKDCSHLTYRSVLQHLQKED